MFKKKTSPRLRNANMKTCWNSPESSVAGIIFLLGIGTLLPWNVFIVSMEYFEDRMRYNNLYEARPDPYMFTTTSVLLAQLPALLFTLLNSLLYHNISEKIRIVGSMIFILLMLVLTTALVEVKMDQVYFFATTVATVWFINMFGAVLQGSMFGLLSQLPMRFISLFMSGQAVAGIFSSFAMLFCNIFRVDSKSIAMWYFLAPCVATLLTLYCYLKLPSLISQLDFEIELSVVLKPKDESSTTSSDSSSNNCEIVSFKNALTGNEDSNESEIYHELDELEGFDQTKLSVAQVFKKIWLMAICEMCVFMVTLSFFPAITVNIKPTSELFIRKEKIFTSMCCFVAFSIMDWAGRSLTTCVQWPSMNSCFFPILVVLRVVFIPALMFCNIQPRSYLSVMFNHDAAFVVIISLLGATNGYFASLCMMYAPKLVKRKDGETAGSLMTFFLALGLALGAGLSFGFKRIV